MTLFKHRTNLQKDLEHLSDRIQIQNKKDVQNLSSIQNQIASDTKTSLEKIGLLGKQVQSQISALSEAAGFLYRGAFDSTKTYYHSSLRRDVVLGLDDNYWITNNIELNAKLGSDWKEPSGDATNWTRFTGEVESFATGLLLAIDATIVKTLTFGSDVTDGIIQSSESPTATNNPSTYLFEGDGFFLGENQVAGKSAIRVGSVNAAGTLTSGYTWDATNGMRIRGILDADDIIASDLFLETIGLGGALYNGSATYQDVSLESLTPGFWLGYDSAVKFQIINSDTKYWDYDGTDFELVGGTITGGTIQTSTSGDRIKLVEDELQFIANDGTNDYIQTLEPLFFSYEQLALTGTKRFVISQHSSDFSQQSFIELRPYTADSESAHVKVSSQSSGSPSGSNNGNAYLISSKGASALGSSTSGVLLGWGSNTGSIYVNNSVNETLFFDSGRFDFLTGDIYLEGTKVIDSSRNATFNTLDISTTTNIMSEFQQSTADNTVHSSTDWYNYPKIRVINDSTTTGAGAQIVFGTSSALAGIAGIREGSNQQSLVFWTEDSIRSEVMRVGHDGVVTAQGRVKADDFMVDGLNTAPSSASGTGTTGEIRFTSTHIYVCVGTNDWKRVELNEDTWSPT